MNKPVYFERALFFSWYCSLGDCTFCYMSVQKDKILDPKKARRRFSSVFAEAILCKFLNWKIEFISGGYDSYSKEELLTLVKGVSSIVGDKVWLNLGTLGKEDLKAFKPYIYGYAGTIETVNWDLRKKVCPSKALEPILQTFSFCEELDLQKAMTLIIGLGETIEDFEFLKEFISKQGISRITFYALNPHPGTPFTASPPREYYAEWIKKTREAFPDVHIIAGAWTDKPEYFGDVLNAGANAITKLPSLRKFGTEEMGKVVSSVENADCDLKSNLMVAPKVDVDGVVEELDSELFSPELKEEIKEKLRSYLKSL